MIKSLAQLQLEFTSCLRDPAAAVPIEVGARPMGIYRDLVYANIESFIAGFFPVLRSVLNDDLWHNLIRQFIQLHLCNTPYFLEIGQEFLQFLMSNPPLLTDYPPYLLELGHYEWVELALDISSIYLPPQGEDADILEGFPLVSPLAWCLTYQFPVHLIGPSNPAPTPQLCHLVVYRNRALDVKFLAANPLTLRLLQLLQTPASGRAASLIIAAEIAHPEPEKLVVEAKALIAQLLALEIIVGVALEPPALGTAP